MGLEPAAIGSDKSSGYRVMWERVLGAVRDVYRARPSALLYVWLGCAFVVRPIFLAAHNGASGGVFDAVRSKIDISSLAFLTGAIQWLSFALTMAVVAAIHLRMSKALDTVSGEAERFVTASVYVVAMTLGYVVFLWSPSSTLTLMTHDTFIFVDAVYRISAGQVPSVDFHTPIGAAALYLPALGAWLAGGYAGSVELASVLLALSLGLACAYVVAGRAPIVVAIVLVATIFMVSVPSGLLGDWESLSATFVFGEPVGLANNLTHAMFYNRWGWGALIVVLAFLLPRADRTTKLGEIAVFAGILALLFYLKLSYFVVAVGAALLFAFLNDRPVRTLSIGAGVSLVIILLIGVPTGILAGYASEILRVAEISGGRAIGLGSIMRGELGDILLACVPLGILGFGVRLGWRDLAVAGLILAGTLFVMNQNAQKAYLPTLVVLAAYGVVRLQAQAELFRRQVALGAFVLLAMVPMVERSMVMMDQAVFTRGEEIRPLAPWSEYAALENVYIVERESAFDLHETLAPDKVISVAGRLGRRQELRQGEFMETVVAGVDELRPIVLEGESVVVLDMSNPFNSILATRPAHGDWLSLHDKRTVSADIHPAPEDMFSDADHVMIAKISMLQETADLMGDLYGDWLSAHYETRSETRFWVRYSNKNE